MAKYRSTSNMADQNSVIGPVKLPTDRACSISIQTDTGNAVNAVLVLEFSNDDVTFLTLAAVDPTDDVTVVTTYTGASKAGYTRYPRAYSSVRARRSDANGGVCNGTLMISPC